MITATISNEAPLERRFKPGMNDAFVYPAAGRENDIECLKGDHDKNSPFHQIHVIDGEEVKVESVAVQLGIEIFLINGNKVVLTHKRDNPEGSITLDLNYAFYIAGIKDEQITWARDPETKQVIYLSKRDEEALSLALNASGTNDPDKIAVKRIKYPELTFPEEDLQKEKVVGHRGPMFTMLPQINSIGKVRRQKRLARCEAR